MATGEFALGALKEEFEVIDYLYPYAIVTRKSDSVRGTVKWHGDHWSKFERIENGPVNVTKEQ